MNVREFDVFTTFSIPTFFNTNHRHPMLKRVLPASVYYCENSSNIPKLFKIGFSSSLLSSCTLRPPLHTDIQQKFMVPDLPSIIKVRQWSPLYPESTTLPTFSRSILVRVINLLKFAIKSRGTCPTETPASSCSCSAQLSRKVVRVKIGTWNSG